MRRPSAVLPLATALLVGCGRKTLEEALSRELLSNADRVVIQVIDDGGKPTEVIGITDAETLRAITEPLGACKGCAHANYCQPPIAEIRLFERDRLLVSARPTRCCGQFTIDGVLYEDSSRKLLSVVKQIIEANRAEARD